MKKSLLKIFIFISALTFSNSVWGFTSTLKDANLRDGFNKSTKKVTWSGNHVTFSFSGSYLYMTGSKGWLVDSRILYMPNDEFGTVFAADGANYQFSWNVENGYEITVTRVAIDMDRASGDGYYLTVGNGNPTDDLYHSKNIPEGGVSSGTMSCGNTDVVNVTVSSSWSWSTVALKSLTIEYTIKPQINASNGTVKVTICDDNKKTIDLKDLAKPVVTSGHVSYSYSIVSVAPAANTSATTSTGHISGSTFYATQAGVYTLRISAESATCHQANSKTFTVTVTPAELELEAPTASDIRKGHTLSDSELTGGSATVSGCGEVAGTWAWKYPSTAPEVGDDQPFAVVFTPTSNPGNYSNKETVAYVDVKRALFVFDGSGHEVDDPNHITWCYDDNWEENQKPGSEDEVLIEHDVVIRQEVSAYSVTIADGKSLTIMPTGGLTVGAGGIIGATQNNLIIKAGQADDVKGQTGYLRVNPATDLDMPAATIELYTKAYYDMKATDHNETGEWQFVGYPLRDGASAKTVFSKSFLYNWNDSTAQWENNRTSCILQPFEGYATSQYRNAAGWLITFTGELVQNVDQAINLAYNAGDEFTQNMVANSYSAPIDVTKFEDSDFDNMQAAVYIFNTGSRADIKNLSDAKSGDCNIAGQYLSIPIGSARAMKGAFETPTIIAPMQGFCVHATGENAQLRLDYEKLVWNGNYATNKNEPLHINARKQEAEQVNSLCVSLYGEGVADNLYMLESDQYDTAFENGYDAKKMNSGEANIFSVEGDDYLAVDATNSLIGTQIGVRTGDTTAYVLVFTHLNSERPLSLLDNETNETIDINEGTEYTFFAVPNSEITGRFSIVESANAPTVTTGIEETNTGVKAQKFIKDGQLYILKNGVLYTATGVVVR